MEEMEELISVIVPVYNIEKYLPKCLDCISKQTYRHLEIILVDDGSNDSSGQMCDEYALKDGRTKVIHQENKGLWAARNTGQEAARGEYLFFPDGDDYFHYDLIRLLYEAINLDPQYDLAIARSKKTWNTEIDIVSAVELHTLEQTGDDLIHGLFAKGDDQYYVYMWNKLYRRRLIQGFRSRAYVRSQDFDINFRIFLNVQKAILIDRDLYFWLQRPNSLTKMKGSFTLFYMCRTRIFFRNYCDLPVEKAEYRPLLLSRLYKMMVFWKAHSVGGDNQRNVFTECGRYEQITRMAYLTNDRIPIFEILACLFFLHLPHLSHFVLKITKNL